MKPSLSNSAQHEEASSKVAAIPCVVLVGGFLGVGKTTLLLASVRELARRGLRSAIVLNDQGDDLVDRRFAAQHDVLTEEVTGGCFCYRFSELTRRIDLLRGASPDVIFAEPAGSCTDLAATVLRPLREYLESCRLAPLTVLVDPERAEALMRPDADQNLSFLFRKQIDEADLVCFSKSDIHPSAPDLGRTGIRQISARTNQGVAAWLDEVLSGMISPGGKHLDLDYSQYAQAEAALAWLNLHTRIQPQAAIASALLLGPLLDDLGAELSKAGITIAHLKAIVNSESGFIKAAVCANGAEPEVEGTLDASAAVHHELFLNLRCVGDAKTVRNIVEKSQSRIGSALTDLHIACFHPSQPNPERRAI